MKKLLVAMMVAVLPLGVLAGCTKPAPTDTVKEFLTAVQKGDYEKARTFVEDTDNGFEFSKMTETKDGISGEEMFKAITKNYKFKDPVEVSNTDDAAEVKVEITSVDMASAMTKTLAEIMPVALASAFSENKEESEKKMEELTATTIMKHITADDAATATREVTLNVKKDKDGNYKIVANEELGEALLAKSKELENKLKQN
ncbi:hypothetical protein [Priestia taiwanensis]|uniref:DUF4878 domain-containing protein n=1 Tax=Priestia taiwanensis TaxID=1347902 RepID=A0A917AJV9_9BACI|nr:hypothetical protein [Priestia taiwanensis]MBM7361832.1 hypothetical protein [Priestia taiwanensis]GGE57302.1 hypothetical protein GCM10007140_04570 [Priestia taiwanensis]